MRGPRRTLRDAVRAAVPAAVLSGLPSTAHALVTRRDPLEASTAAGSILLPHEQSRLLLVAAAIPVHATLSTIWTIAISRLLPGRSPAAEGAVAGLAIAGFDLGIIGRRYPRVRALKPLPQVADHVAFGFVASIALARRDRRKR